MAHMMGEKGGSRSSRAPFCQTAGQEEVWRLGSDDRDQDPLPDPTQTLSQELIPGYLTPVPFEFSVSVSTGPAHRKRELQSDSQQSPDDGRPSTSSKRSHRASAASTDSSPAIMSSTLSLSPPEWLCWLKSVSSRGDLWRSGDESDGQYEQDGPVEPTETSGVFMEALPVNKSSTVHMIELPKWKTGIMALKRKHSSSAQVYESHQSSSSTSSTKNYQPVSVGEENAMAMRKRRRMDSVVKLPSLLYCDWSGNSDQTTAPIHERRAEDRDSLQNSACALEDPGLQEPLSSGLEVLPPADQQPVNEGSDSQERPRRKSSSGELRSLHWSSSSDQGQSTAAISERHTEDRDSLQNSACALEDPGLQEPLSSGLEVLPPADQQVQTPPAPVQHGPEPGDILSRYEIGRKLGEGGYGSVYEAIRLEDGLEVAVKIARKPQMMKYIYIFGHPAPLPLEVGLLILVNRGPKVPEIIELLDWQDQPDQYIMVLEHPSPCKDLWDFTEVYGGTLNEDMARFIMAQATMAAHMCCLRGVFHRDIKLENLLINTETLEVKLIDFGCRDLLQESGYERFTGTPQYRPPEYYTEGKYHGTPATAWSLGVLLFLLVCGRFPKHRDRQMIDADIWSEPGLSNECCHLIRSLLQENPRRRMDLGEILRHEWFKTS